MRLKRLVNDLVDLGALQSGAYWLEIAPIKVAPFLASCLEAARPAASKAEIVLDGGMTPGTPPILHSDEARLRQLAMILIDAALAVSTTGHVVAVARRGHPASADEAGMCAGECIEFAMGDASRITSAPMISRQALPATRQVSASDRSKLRLVLAARLCVALGGRLVAEPDTQVYIVRLPLGLPVAERQSGDPALSPVLPTGV